MALLSRAQEDRPPPRRCAPLADVLAPDMRVLVVEDDPIQALLLLSFLERLGVGVQHVVDGMQAVAAARRDGFALVLMDVQMPQVDGREATRMIRAWEQVAQRARLPIVAVTAGAMQEECEGCMAAGMDAVLLKPFTVHALRQVLMRHARPLAHPAT